MEKLQKGELIILGMGNKLFGDDGAGVIVAEKLSALLSECKQIAIEETNWGGLRIIDLLSGYKSAIIIDALKTGMQKPGHVYVLNYRDLIHSVRMVAFHEVNFATAVEFAREMHIPIPDEIKVYAIEINSSDNFSEELSGEVADAVESCVQMILNEIGKLGIDVNHQLETG
jgi:hydrogenase maturation protease